MRTLAGQSTRLGMPAVAILLIVLSSACTHLGPAGAQPWRDARQLVLVITSDWEARSGQLRTYRKTAGGWRPVAAPAPVMIGRSGSAWGIGLHPPQHDGPAKQEGDGRAPAGVFAIGTAFGYAGSAGTALPYAAMRRSDWCIDVSDSPLYNLIVDADTVGWDRVSGSSEPMRRDLHVDGDQRYRLGFVINHNPGNAPGAGSCIFAHLWKAPDETTAGCTAMAESAMRELLAWLAPRQHPVFVLLPRQQYERVRAQWGLPVIDHGQ